MRAFLRRFFGARTVQLFLLAFLVYNANLRSVTSLDTYPTRFLPISIIRERDLDLDEFPFLHRYPEWWHSDRKHEFPYYLTFSRGHYMSTYPVMPAILSVPVYLIPVVAGLPEIGVAVSGYNGVEIVATFLSKLSASLAVALSVPLVYLAALHLSSRRAALWAALVYAVGTSSWSVSSQGLWQTAMSQPLVALALYLLVRGRTHPWSVAVAGVPLALAVASRYSTAVMAAILAAYVFRYHRNQFRWFALFPAVLAILLLAYNLYHFAAPVHMGPANLLRALDWRAFLGLVVSPGRGMLIYSPVLVFAFLPLLDGHLRRDPLLKAIGIATVATILLYSAWERWDAAFSYSYRFLVDLLPGLALYLAIALQTVLARRPLAVTFFGLTAVSVLVQIVGAFFYPCGWYETPVSAALVPSRFWDWTDLEVIRCLRNGPVEAEGWRLLTALLRR